MLLFQTIFDIADDMTKDEFIELVLEWNQNSPHAENIIAGIEWKGERNIKYGDNNLWLSIEEYRNNNIIAVRYEKQDAEGITWDSDYVMNFSERKLAIRLERSYAENALNMSGEFSTPYFIKLLLDKGYKLGNDTLPVSYKPIFTSTLEVGILENIVSGTCNLQIPVIIVLKPSEGEYALNYVDLAYRLKGIAHVLVQDDNGPIETLANLEMNIGEGDILVCYPNSVVKPVKYALESFVEQKEYWTNKLCRQVIYYNSSKKIGELYTWQGVSNALIKDKFISQSNKRKAAEEACNKAEQIAYELMDNAEATKKELLDKAKEEERLLSAEYEAEMESLIERVEKLTRDNERLRNENDGLKYKMDEFDTKPILYMGSEQEFFPGEIQDLLLSMLKNHLKDIDEGSRRQHIIQDLLKTNDYKGYNEKNTEKIKNIMRGYTSLDSKTSKALHELGFTISEDGKHYKVKYHDDNRYQFTFAKTASDHRAGMNDAARVSKKVF